MLIEWLYTHQKGNLVYYDKLTQAYNRNWWELKAKKNLKNKSAYITLIDMDELKQVNDSLGHIEGDNYIVKLIQDIKSIFPKADICRLGGDEFILITNSDPSPHLQRMLNKHSFSFGVTYKYTSIEPTEILRQSDMKMYEMKMNRKSSR